MSLTSRTRTDSLKNWVFYKLKFVLFIKINKSRSSLYKLIRAKLNRVLELLKSNNSYLHMIRGESYSSPNSFVLPFLHNPPDAGLVHFLVFWSWSIAFSRLLFYSFEKKIRTWTWLVDWCPQTKESIRYILCKVYITSQ